MDISYPDSLNYDALRNTLVALVIVSVIAVIVVIAVVRNVTYKIVAALVIGALGIGIFVYWTSLEDCEKTCDCRFLRSDIVVDSCPDTG